MRIEIPAREVMPGDLIWFSGDRKPTAVIEAAVQDGAERLVVLTSEANKIWYMRHDSAVVYKYEADPVEDEDIFLDPAGNPT